VFVVTQADGGVSGRAKCKDEMSEQAITTTTTRYCGSISVELRDSEMETIIGGFHPSGMGSEEVGVWKHSENVRGGAQGGHVACRWLLLSCGCVVCVGAWSTVLMRLTSRRFLAGSDELENS
jgi:hypothetical protein